MQVYRESRLGVLTRVVIQYYQIVLVTVGFLVWWDVAVIWKCLIAVTVALFILGYAILAWRSKWFTLDDTYLMYYKGILFKRKVEIMRENIVTVTQIQPFIYRVLKLCILQIDSGVIEMTDLPDFIVLKKDANTVKEHLLANVKSIEVEKPIVEDATIQERVGEETTQEDKSVKGTPQAIYRMGILQNCCFACCKNQVVFCITLIGIIVTVLLDMDTEMKQDLECIVWSDWKTYVVIGCILIAMQVLFRIGTVLRNYNFRVIQEGVNIEVTCGLLGRKNYRFSTGELFVIHTTESLRQRMLHAMSVSYTIRGVGDESDVTSYIFPWIKKKQLDEYIGVICPRFCYKGNQLRIHPHYRMRRPHIEFGYSDTHLYIRKGWFTKKSSIIDLTIIDSIKKVQAPWQRKWNTCTMKVSYQGMTLLDISKIRGMELSQYQEIEELVQRKANETEFNC